MGPVTADEVCRELVEFLSVQVLGGVPLVSDAAFSDAGVDSFALMEAVLFIERRFGVVVPVERLTREHVRSAQSLSLCVADLVASTP